MAPTKKLKLSGFILIESILACAFIMLAWYLITQCAVQAIILEQQIEQKIMALVVASTTIEKLRSGLYLLKDQTVKERGMLIVIKCGKALLHNLLYPITLTVLYDTQELLCIKTAVLQA